jgi:hypothetical protein
MLCTVSTIKDTRAGVERHVERNLAAGADHMFLMLEADDDGVVAAFRDHPHVTGVLTDDGYWTDRRPQNLNVRQRVNADLVNTLLSFFPDAEWLFHLDGDEVLDLDRAWLGQLPSDVRCVSLTPLEAVAKLLWDGEVDRFKRLLDPNELALLHALGVLSRPNNRIYFRGHKEGKPGLRPALDLSMGDALHWVTDRYGEAPEHHISPSLQMLHYDSYDGEEFVRKWEAHLSGGGAGFRGPKSLQRDAIRGVQQNERLGLEQRRDYLREVFERLVADPVDQLEELGYLVSPDPARHSYTPTPLPAQERELMGALWGELVRSRKQPFKANDPDAVRRLLVNIHDRVRRKNRPLAERMASRLPAPFEGERAQGRRAVVEEPEGLVRRGLRKVRGAS